MELTSGDMERETWVARQLALVNMFRYLKNRIIECSYILLKLN